MTTNCQNCGTELPVSAHRARPRKWCSDACRKRAASRPGSRPIPAPAPLDPHAEPGPLSDAMTALIAAVNAEPGEATLVLLRLAAQHAATLDQRPGDPAASRELRQALLAALDVRKGESDATRERRVENHRSDVLRAVNGGAA